MWSADASTLFQNIIFFFFHPTFISKLSYNLTYFLSIFFIILLWTIILFLSLPLLYREKFVLLIVTFLFFIFIDVWPQFLILVLSHFFYDLFSFTIFFYQFLFFFSIFYLLFLKFCFLLPTYLLFFLFFFFFFPLHFLGIGDRHAQNVLIDTVTGELVQIDFGIVLEQGKSLATPETVPFRLTR